MDEYIRKDAVLATIEYNDKVCHYADEQLEKVVYATAQACCKAVAELPSVSIESAVKIKLNSVYGISAKYPHIARMQRERDVISDGLDRLCTYYDECSVLLSEKQRDLMCKQITAMRSYVDILQQRINYDIQYYSSKEVT